MSEPSCQHSYLPGGMGCAMCESEAFEAYRRRLRERTKQIEDTMPKPDKPTMPVFEITPRRTQAAIKCLREYVQERQQAVEKGLFTNPVDAIRMMSEINFFKEQLADDAKSPAEKLYDTLRFTTVPNVMDGEGITQLGVEGVGKVNLQDDVTVKTEDKEALFKWLTDNQLEDMITEQVNAQTLAAFVRRRIKEAAEKKKAADLPNEKIITIKPIVRAVITRG